MEVVAASCSEEEIDIFKLQSLESDAQKEQLMDGKKDEFPRDFFLSQQPTPIKLTGRKTQTKSTDLRINGPL